MRHTVSTGVRWCCCQSPVLVVTLCLWTGQVLSRCGDHPLHLPPVPPSYQDHLCQLSVVWRAVTNISTTGQVRLCDVQDKMSVAEVSQDLVSGNAVSVLQSGPSPASFLLCAGTKILLLDTGTCQLDRDLSHPSLNPVTCAQFNHNGNVLIHASIDGKISINLPSAA